MSSTYGTICLTLRDCSWPMKCQRNSGCLVALASRSCARFSPSSVSPASPSTPSSSSGTYLTAASSWTSAGSRPASAIVERTRSRLAWMLGGVEAGDQTRHMTPAWRPVTPWSRRCEKKRSSQIVHRPTSMTSMPWARELLGSPPRPGPGCARRGARRRRRSARGPPRRPRSSSRARSGRARRRSARRRRPRAAPARPRRRSRPPAAASRSAARPRRRARRAGPAGSRRRRRSRRRRSSAVAWPSSCV